MIGDPLEGNGGSVVVAKRSERAWKTMNQQLQLPLAFVSQSQLVERP